MSIRMKVARSAEELDDVFRLRYNVYVRERGKFSKENLIEKEPRIVDRFDAVPEVANVIAYRGNKAIAAMRVNKDSKIGLPAEDYFDFSETRAKIEKEYPKDGVKKPVFVSGSMLAIDNMWRNRRNVIFALFKMAAGVMHDWGGTHVIGSISEETLSLYGRIGFKPISEPKWNSVVDDSLVSIVAPFAKVFKWTIGGIGEKVDKFWLDNFCGQFERLLLSPGEILFFQGDEADNAYAIDEGWISISRSDEEGNDMILANLSRGALFGELAVFDKEPRSATAKALTNVGLIVLGRKYLHETITKHPEKIGQLLTHFSKRVRELDDLAMVKAFAPQTGRVYYALRQLWNSAEADRKNPKYRYAKVGPHQIAESAQVREDEVLGVLETEMANKNLEYGKQFIRFHRKPQQTEVHMSESKVLTTPGLAKGL